MFAAIILIQQAIIIQFMSSGSAAVATCTSRSVQELRGARCTSFEPHHLGRDQLRATPLALCPLALLRNTIPSKCPDHDQFDSDTGAAVGRRASGAKALGARGLRGVAFGTVLQFERAMRFDHYPSPCRGLSSCWSCAPGSWFGLASATWSLAVHPPEVGNRRLLAVDVRPSGVPVAHYLVASGVRWQDGESSARVGVYAVLRD
ncbi:hypothetical protein EVG20_g9112 [Dentipellis fragilis]|uniref:Secreted protein n=1 Tax=Dentipellis fragilis TaxID=205917 RepID=A0A4Y9Y0H2_9AGAM|nr:hypothetical protein EVG20_g9112 [Dentipellis fragilis]